MKKLLHILLLLAATCSLYSCSKKDKDEKAFLYGNWNVTSEHYVSALNGATYTDTKQTYPDGARTMTFGADLQFSHKDTESAGDSWQGTYDVKDNKLILYIQYGKDTIPYTYSYTLSGVNMTIVNSGTNTVPEGTITYSNTLELVKK